MASAVRAIKGVSTQNSHIHDLPATDLMKKLGSNLYLYVQRFLGLYSLTFWDSVSRLAEKFPRELWLATRDIVFNFNLTTLHAEAVNSSLVICRQLGRYLGEKI